MNDRIEKKILLKAPRSRVWRALVDRSEFGEWFGVRFPAGQFKPGQEVSGQITYPGYEHVKMTIEVESIEPERLLSYRWHPGAPDPNTDYSAEPTTLVSFTLAESEGGTLLTVVESGFDRIPPERRESAWRSNDSGWAEQMTRIERHVAARA